MGSFGMAQADESVAERNKAIVRASFDAWTAGTGNPFELLAEDATWTITGNSAAAGSYAGKEAFLSEVIRPFNARMSAGLKPAIQDIYVDGDMVIVLFDASGTARDGQTYANTYAWFLGMRDGLILRAQAFFDSIAFDDLWARVEPGPSR
ncbi:nuclear transport factor 2 family protein [Geminicoccus flavidas]|uniref:nuclear transport factor 2 family protein n=1 Tax=Geminicoccus flavidas TaxID=2506407 RepID=UPI0038B33AE6